MKEATIKTAIKKKLEAEGYVLWFVHKRALKISPTNIIWRSCDIHTIYDTIALRGSEIRLIQYTSVSNTMARMKKIEKYYKEHKLSVPCEVWGYRGRGKWLIEKMYQIST